MKEIPVLMTTPLVLATLREIYPKTQTRRMVAPQPEWTEPETVWQCGDGHSGPGWYAHNGDYPEEGALHYRCRYGQPGDRLWVRETHFAFGRWETRFSEKKGRDEWHFVDMTLETGHAHLFEAPKGWTKTKRAGATPAWWRRPAIFMPRVACRLVLKVTGVRVERLQAITEADALSEGVGSPITRDCKVPKFARLWDEINGPGSWEENPWVWVVEFKRVEVSHG